MKVLGIIPARYESSRFPGKPLAKILGKSMIQRVYEQSKKCIELNELIIATDDKRIYKHALTFNANVMMTSKSHTTGTDRCGEVVRNLKKPYDIVVNIQGDEPLINPFKIKKVISLFNNSKTDIATLAKKIISNKIIKDKNTPKVMIDNCNKALQFCRKIEDPMSFKKYYQHIGIYAYKSTILEKIINLPQTINEKKENLEQLRWLDHSYKIYVGITNLNSVSVDTPDDIIKVENEII